MTKDPYLRLASVALVARAQRPKLRVGLKVSGRKDASDSKTYRLKIKRRKAKR